MLHYVDQLFSNFVCCTVAVSGARAFRDWYFLLGASQGLTWQRSHVSHSLSSVSFHSPTKNVWQELTQRVHWKHRWTTLTQLQNKIVQYILKIYLLMV